MLGPTALAKLNPKNPVFDIARQVGHGFFGMNCAQLAAAISYYSLFSLFPLTLALISVFGYIMRSDNVEAFIIQQIVQFLPVSQELVVNTIESLIQTRNTAGVLATIGLFWTSMAVFSTIRKAINAAWGIHQPRPFLHDRFIDLLLMAGAGLLFLSSIAATAFLSVAHDLSILFYGPTVTNGLFPWELLARIVSPLLAFLTFLFIYRFIPNTRVSFQDVWVGAMIATIGLEISKTVFVNYAQNLSNLNLVYGSFSAIVALLLWSYISALILLIGASISSICHRAWGPGVSPDADALYYLRQ